MRVRNSRLVGHDNRSVPFVTSPNTGGALAGGRPRFLVIHYTAGGQASGSIAWFANRDSKVSAHLVIDREGKITQMVPFDTVGHHAGASRWKGVNGLNRHSVGIELANWGQLRRSGAGGWLSATGQAVPGERVVLAEHRNSPGIEHGWEVFDEAQFFAAVAAAQAIVREYGIGPTDVVGHDDISPGRKIDPGPALPMAKFRSLVFGRAEDEDGAFRARVRSDTGLNLRTEPRVSGELIRNLSDGTLLRVLEAQGLWWMVSELDDAGERPAGFVNSRFLEEV